uniref:Uncharacterized protein n=1 Tax=Leersia perrieri TaxID=77586 RepID=A0A0D9X2W7_9ORYZ
MDADAELLETLSIMFTVIIFGLVIIIGIFIVQPHKIAALVSSVLVAFLAWSSIKAKTSSLRLQHTGHPDPMLVMIIHLFEIGLALMVLLELQFRVVPDLSNLFDRGIVSWMMILGNWLYPMAIPWVQFFLFILATGGDGMGVLLTSNRPVLFIVRFYHAGLAVFISISLIMVQACLRRATRDAVVRHAEFDARSKTLPNVLSSETNSTKTQINLQHDAFKKDTTSGMPSSLDFHPESSSKTQGTETTKELCIAFKKKNGTRRRHRCHRSSPTQIWPPPTRLT